MAIEITEEHLRTACDNAEAGGAKYGDDYYAYNQGQWCGTACCLWGHAHLAANGTEKGAKDGPSQEWIGSDLRRAAAANIMRNHNSKPSQLREVLDWAWDGVSPLKIKGDLDLSGSAITSLPQGLTVGGDLYLPWGRFTTVESARKKQPK